VISTFKGVSLNVQ